MALAADTRGASAGGMCGPRVRPAETSRRTTEAEAPGKGNGKAQDRPAGTRTEGRPLGLTTGSQRKP